MKKELKILACAANGVPQAFIHNMVDTSRVYVSKVLKKHGVKGIKKMSKVEKREFNKQCYIIIKAINKLNTYVNETYL